MKKFNTLSFLFLVIVTQAQIVNIPDANFKAKLLQASSSNTIASSQSPVYNATDGTLSVTSYNNIDANNDGEIQVTETQAIKWLNIENSSILNLTGLDAFINLQYLDCGFNHLTTLDVSGLTNLQQLYCSQNQLTSLNVSGLSNLQYLSCGNNQLTSLNVSGLSNLQDLNCDSNQLTTLNVSGLSNLRRLDCSTNQLTTLNVLGLSNLQSLGCSTNQLTSLNVSGCTNLQYLDCSGDQLITLNVSGCTNLIRLYCNFNELTSLDVSGLTNLQHLFCYQNQLTTLNISGCTNLSSLSCANNQLTSLNVSGLSNLQYLSCGNNQLTSLNVSGLSNLLHLLCYQNQLTSLNVSGFTNLQSLSCANNQLTSLNVSGLSNLRTLLCFSNQLTTLFINNGNTNWQDLVFSSNPNLHYICADEEDLILVQNKINQYGMGSTCHVNSYCSFTPGGTFYTINGNNRLDSNNNGCDASDGLYRNLKINITNGTQSGSLIANEAGNYSIPVQAGTHTLTPVFENPSYFNVSPATTTVSFPSQSSPFVQNFCITANGVHHDLEVTVVPIGVARPGFDAAYKIVYKNKGNQIENASLTFGYNDNVMDFINASVATTSQVVGQLSWNLGNLAPFQSGTITVSFNLNTPIETPPLNAGNVLAYTATISLIAIDETPTDNAFTLNQTVVNSYDPNDKTCLEGPIINPSKIGDYVTYQIRFENTGTFPAQNIVVKDMIDTAKFDVSMLQIINSSHTCYAKITGNKVEFIFENINLPFADATNDGYVVFKIKSLPTLTVNSTVSNSASIYFDYNFPIITNTATSTYQLLNANSFVFENEFALYPNPVKDNFAIKTKNSLEIQSLEIYNTLGQIVLAIPRFSENVDVSSLQRGTYLVKVNTEKGSSGVRIIKE
ncbi:leucine-rich repeat domain-containing protein [Flavobacterium sp. 20NA77.7]|uniref:Leucine-rich repeat domain-containing protein n=1 Tax=Flavobacterium nakdongensis TaxID=3073563 RepID=A0ABY9RCB7_9FLAO|nr:leucine-rich repeat domain-containing protein [Flavobacterium sp. 20NA77.7]WMW78255.1 leucine-rich repeat domain-containing protein [Flavobacterium sp. 20NA77.7]